MRETLSSTAVSSLFAQETDEVYIILLTISHEQLTPSIRVGSDVVNTISRGETFVSYPFEIQLPSDEEDAPPKAQLAIDNVSPEIAKNLRSITSPASFLIEVVRFSEPDVVEVSYDNFQLRNIKGDVLQITGELTIEDVTLEPYPYDTFTPANFRGLYA